MHTTQTLVQLFNFRVILKCCWTTSIEFLVWRIEKWLIKFIRVVSHDYPMQQQHISLITWPRQTRTLRQPIFLPLFAHLDLVGKKVIELQVPCKKELLVHSLYEHRNSQEYEGGQVEENLSIILHENGKEELILTFYPQSRRARQSVE